MIHYQLRCGAAHEFDAWFRDSAAYEEQAARGLLECPHCGERQVARALMAPAVPRKRAVRPMPEPAAAVGRSGAEGSGADAGDLRGGSAAADGAQEGGAEVADAGAGKDGVAGGAGVAVAAGLPAHLRSALRLLRAEVERRCDYVGKDFAAEARRIHEGESPARSIYGEATQAQAEALADDGIEVSRIPWVPRTDA